MCGSATGARLVGSEENVSTKAVLAMTLVVEGIVPEADAEEAAQRMIPRMRSAATELVNAGSLADALEAELASQHSLVALTGDTTFERIAAGVMARLANAISE
jgi:enoyl-CoA hydratase/carnithine racemase